MLFCGDSTSTFLCSTLLLMYVKSVNVMLCCVSIYFTIAATRQKLRETQFICKGIKVIHSFFGLTTWGWKPQILHKYWLSLALWFKEKLLLRWKVCNMFTCIMWSSLVISTASWQCSKAVKMELQALWMNKATRLRIRKVSTKEHLHSICLCMFT